MQPQTEEQWSTACQRAGESLLGGSEVFDGAVEDAGFDPDSAPQAFYAGVNDVTFQCAGCGWWCEIQEQSDVEGDTVCVDCAPEFG